jgi:hypothetical protein
MTRLLFGADNPQAPLYVVTMGGGCLLAAALCVGLVEDRGGPVPERDVVAADTSEPFLVGESLQPVPSTGRPRNG